MIGRVIRGGCAGLGATLAMSTFMFAGKRFGLMGTPPPKRITANAERKIGVEPRDIPEPVFTFTWAVAHVGYGVCAGVAYPLIRGALPENTAASGAVYGVLLWAISYLGIMPALGLYPTPREDSTVRTITMIAAHEVYGETLARLSR